MSNFLLTHYEWLRALHIISVIAWMAGMLYLPRLFVYHAEAAKGSDKSETFKVMERKLLRLIINPSMGAAFIFGGLMLWANPALFSEVWMHVKLACIFIMAALHGYFARIRKIFARDENQKSSKFYRYINEIPALLMVIIVIMAVVQPF